VSMLATHPDWRMLIDCPAGFTRAPGSADRGNTPVYATLGGNCTAKPSRSLGTVSGEAFTNQRMRIFDVISDIRGERGRRSRSKADGPGHMFFESEGIL
jgi:hypothetical protein